MQKELIDIQIAHGGIYILQMEIKREAIRGINMKKLSCLSLVQVTGKLAALKGLDARLQEIRSYLDLVIDGKLPLNHEILCHLQVPLILVLSGQTQ